MSNYHLTAVSRADFKKTGLPARHRLAAKSVMKVFADYANQHDLSWPHVETIALEAGCGKDTVSAATDACVKANLLRKRKTQTGNKYVINMRELKRIEVPRPNRRNPDMPDFDDRDLHENPPEPETAGHGTFSEEPETSDDQGFSEQPETDPDQAFPGEPKTEVGSSNNGFRQGQLGKSEEPTQIPYGSPSDPAGNPHSAPDGAPHGEPDLFGGITEGLKDPKADPAARFDEFWSCVPLKKGRKKALDNWVKAVKAGTEPQTMIDGIKRYTQWCREEGKTPDVIKWPQGWISERRWNDEIYLRSEDPVYRAATERQNNGQSRPRRSSSISFYENDDVWSTA